MNTELVKNNVERLESVFRNIIYLKPEDRVITPDMSILGDLKDILNEIFNENHCIDAIYTRNTDKQFFGIRISPRMSPKDAITIMSTEDSIRLDKYQIEFDSRLFEIGLSADEITAITIYEIYAMMDNNTVFENIRACLDSHAIHNDDIIKIKDSANYAQLIIFALKDTMHKFSSIIYKHDEEELLSNVGIQIAGYEEEIVSALQKINAASAGLGETMRYGKPVILTWMFVMMKDIRNNRQIITDALKDAKTFTASKLEIEDINKTITAMDHLDMTIIESTRSMDLNKFFDQKNIGSLNEVSIFKNLKRNGLRGLEAELYEFSMKVKNCSTAEDAYLIMRGINARIGILEDYLANENLSDYDEKHWSDVCNRYKQLRDILANKKFENKSYGLFWDYSKVFDNEENK